MVLVNIFPDCNVVLSPVVLGLSVAIHVNVELMFAISDMFAVAPLQMVVKLLLISTGSGFTVTVTVCEAPKQPAVEVGVTV